MADILKNISKSFSDSKTRTIVMVILLVMAVGLTIGYFRLKKTNAYEAGAGAEVSSVPSIQSLPGAGQPSREYVRLQEKQNVQLTKEALKKGTSALPTVTRPTYLDIGGLEDLSKAAGAASASGCSVEDLKKARQAGVKAAELRCRGCSLAALKAAGFTAGELREAGFSAKELLDAGFSAKELRDAGFSAKELKDAGLSAAELAAAGFTVGELQKAGFSDQELLAAGFSQASINNAKQPATITSCSLESLREARLKGVSAKVLKDSGCSASALKAAGFTAGELRAAGFSAADLLKAGYSVKDLKDAGFGADELKAAGVSIEQLRAAGYTDGDLVRGGYVLPASLQGVGTIPTAAGAQPTPATATVVGGGSAQVAGGSSLSQQELERMRREQVARMTLQEYQDKLKQEQASMNTQALELFAAWTPVAGQQFVQGEKPAPQAAQQGQAAPVGALEKAGYFGPTENIKAGSILFGVLDTGINSDEKSPIMATIVEGKLRGAKLLGSFQRVEEKVVLQFTTLSLPSLNSSIPINAVAIDANTARTALASSVDNHYLLRYGTLFASSFMSGVGQAVRDSGDSVTINYGTGETMRFKGGMAFGKAAVSGLGEVGTRLADALKPTFNRAPTVTVKSGSGIGLLLMGDLTVPK
jgi:intracellular multiplication protein IcmE